MDKGLGKSAFFCVICFGVLSILRTGTFQGSQSGQRQVLLLSAGPKGGLYFQVATGIKKILEENHDNLQVIVIPSEGSVENLHRLKNGIADWAIIQRDVAVDAFYDKQEPYRDFEVILPLFPEAVQIFLNRFQLPDSDGTLPFSDFIQKLYNEEISRIAIGPEGSGSNQTIKNILALYGISPRHSGYVQSLTEASIQDFYSRNIDAIAGVWGMPYPPIAETQPTIMVTFDRNDLSRILSHLHNLDPITIPAHTYSNIDNPVHTIGSWSLLVGRKEFNKLLNRKLPHPKSPIQSLLNSIGYVQELAFVHKGYLQNEYFHLEKEEGIYRFSFLGSDSKKFFRGLPLNEELQRITQNTFSGIYLFLLILLLLIFLFFRIRSKSRVNEKIQLTNSGFYVKSNVFKDFWEQHKLTILAGLIAFSMFIPLSFLLRYFETKFYANVFVTSPLTELSQYELLRWLFIFALTGYEQGIFPLSVGGQIIATFSTFLGWTAVIIAIIFELVLLQRRQKRRLGMQPTKLNSHIVICGSNERLPVFLAKCLQAKSSFIKKHMHKYLVLDNNFKKYLDNNSGIRKMVDTGLLEYIDGDAKKAWALEMANVDKAHAVILLAEDRSREADEHTLLRALSISRFCREKAGQPALDAIYIIAEINHEEFKTDLINADVNEVVCSSDFAENIILQSSYNHGISEVLEELLSYNEFNEFYQIDVADYPKLINKNFDELLIELRKKGMLLIGIKISFYENGKELIDVDEIRRYLNQLGLKRHIIVNPLTEEETNYRAKESDKLIVIAMNEKSIRKALK
ncbi:MAG: TAXI family TRAP transporter solute-binding subunit [Calditrichaeota bacterium]|nr:MAG: TAXI family TRAP transporter solute-binding subunit [Calditrichota bacterium]